MHALMMRGVVLLESAWECSRGQRFWPGWVAVQRRAEWEDGQGDKGRTRYVMPALRS